MYLELNGKESKENHKRFQWFVTNACNKNCSYCLYVNERKKNIWYDKNIKKIVDEINDLQQKENNLKYNFLFIGGEPLLHKDLIKYKDEIDIEYSLRTNLEFDFNYIKKFFSKNLYAFNTSIHFENNVKRVINNIKNIKNEGFCCSVNVMLENNVSENKIIDTYEELKEIGCDEVKLLPLILTNKKEQSLYYKNIDITKFKKYINNILKKDVVIIKNYEQKIFSTILSKFVKCDIGKYFGCIKNGIYYRCTSYAANNKQGLKKYDKDYFEKETICINNVCYMENYARGHKKGYFLIS